MQQKYNKIFLKGILLIFLVLLLPMIIAQETLKDPGVTPDSPLWGLDKALEQISLFLKISPNSKVTKGLEIASERLSEVKVMIEENKLEAAEKAQKEHNKTLIKIKQTIQEIEDMGEIIKIKKRLEEHFKSIEQIFNELKIESGEEISQQEEDLINSIFDELETSIEEVNIEIENKKNEIGELEVGGTKEEPSITDEGCRAYFTSCTCSYMCTDIPSNEIIDCQKACLPEAQYTVSKPNCGYVYDVCQELNDVTPKSNPTFITSNVGKAERPVLYENKIVWGNGDDIFMYNLVTEEETQITTDPSRQINPDIYENIIVWEDYRTGNSSIFTFNLITKEEIQIAQNPSINKKNPKIYGNKIVYRAGDRFELGKIYDSNIFMYDLSTGEETQITNNPLSQYSPDIYKDIIVWSNYWNVESGNIFMYNLSSGEEQGISNVITILEYPAIYENIVVWADYRNINADVFTYIIAGRETQITTDPSIQKGVSIYNNKIVWQDLRNGNWDIYMYDLSTEEEIQITTDPSIQSNPFIYDNKIVWLDFRNKSVGIYMYTLN